MKFASLIILVSVLLTGCATVPNGDPAASTDLSRVTALVNGAATDFAAFIETPSGQQITESVLAGLGDLVFLVTPDTVLSKADKATLLNELWAVSVAFSSVADATVTPDIVDQAVHAFGPTIASAKYAALFGPVSRLVQAGVGKLQGNPHAVVTFLTVCSRAAQDVATFNGVTQPKP